MVWLAIHQSPQYKLLSLTPLWRYTRNGFARSCAPGRGDVAAFDVGVAADEAEDTAETFAVPRDVESADAADWLRRWRVVRFFDRLYSWPFRGGFRRSGTWIGVADAVVFVAAVVADAVWGLAPGSTPGLMKMPMVTGISSRWMRLSKTIGTRCWPFS